LLVIQLIFFCVVRSNLS